MIFLLPTNRFLVRALTHNSIDTSCTVCQFGFTAIGMDDMVEDDGPPGNFIRYYDYLTKARPIVTSGDRTKFTEVQNIIAQYFLGIDNSHFQLDKMMNSAPRYVRGGSELENFRFSKTLLDIMKSLMSFGFYHDMKRIPEVFFIGSVVMASHRSHYDISNDGTHPDDAQEAEEENKEKEGEDIEDFPLDEEDSLFGDQALNNIGSALNMIKHIREGLEGDETKEGRSRSASLTNKLKSLQYHEGETKDDPNKYLAINLDEDPVDPAAMRRLSVQQPKRLSVQQPKRLSVYQTNNKLPQLEIDDPESLRGSELTRMCIRHDRTKFPEFLRMHIYENQRWFGFSYELEIVLSTRGPFSTPYKDLLLIFNRKHTVDQNPNDPEGLPDATWKWLDDWTIQTTEKKTNSQKEEYMRSEDSEGWFYAVDWMYEFSPQKVLVSNVRKRRWERTCRQKTAMEFIDELIAQGYPQQTLMKVCTNRNVSGDGIFDFNKVTHISTDLLFSLLIDIN
jgi:hypothetical protein